MLATPEIRDEWISQLSDPDETIRAQAAREIYAAGSSLANSAVHTWWQNKDLARLLGGTPELTVGLAVKPQTFATIREANGCPPLADVPPEHDAIEFELHFQTGIVIDVLTSRDTNGDGAIAKFLSRFGEGIQQVEFRCTDVDRAAMILREQFGLKPAYPEKRPGANVTGVNFFLVTATTGKKVLIELYEDHNRIDRRQTER